MGVKGLWTLLEPVGKPVTLESLEGKVLAVDVSIWLHQTVHGMRDKHGDPVANAHLVGLFNRICKLLFYKIKPIFVFDGGVPELKKQTLAARRQQRSDATERSEQATRKLLTGLLKQHAIGSVLGAGQSSQPIPSGSRVMRAEKADMYELPPMPETDLNGYLDDEIERTLEVRATFLDMISEEFQDPEQIDPESADFKALPPELRYELLKELKEYRKVRRWGHTVEMPEKSEDFSQFQIKRMMNRSKLTQQLDGLTKEINANASGDMVMSLTGRAPGEGVESQQLASDETSHYILVKGLKKNSQNPLKDKILEDVKEEKKEVESLDEIEEQKLIEKLIENDTQTQHKESGDIKEEDYQQSSVNFVEIDDKHLNKEPKSHYKSATKKSVTFGRASNHKEVSHSVGNTIRNYSSVNRQENSSCDSSRGILTRPPHASSVDIESDEEIIMIPKVVSDEEQIVPCVDKESPNNEQLPEKTNTTDMFDIMTEGGFIHEESSEADNPPERFDKGSPLNMLPEERTALKDKSNSDDEDESDDSQGGFVYTSSSEVDVEEVQNIVSKNQTENNQPDQVNDDIVVVQSKQAKSKSNSAEKKIDTKSDSIEAEDKQKTVNVETGKIKEEETIGNEKRLLEDVPRPVVIVSSDSEHEASDDAEFEEVPVAEQLALDISYSPLQRHQIAESSGKISNSVQLEPDEPIILEDTEETETLPKSSGVANMSQTETTKTNTPDDSLKAKVMKRPTREQQVAMEEMNQQIEAESQSLQEERSRLDRQAATISDQMTKEAQELLQLFGVPYLVSPMEAEAQCAQLDLTGQTEGTITDDSDIWLFGGRRVYKNMFNHGKYVESYTQHSIHSQLLLDRTKLINLAFLTGSDYTPGIPRVGPVTALEVLAEFPGDGLRQLKNMKAWWNQAHHLPAQKETKIKQKIRQLKLPGGFPNPAVVEAYLKPVVDESEDRFSWEKPDLDLLRTFAAQKLGWSQTKTDESLLPVVKKLSESSMQRHITSFFGIDLGEPKKVKSKRVKNVLNRLKDKNRSEAYLAEQQSGSTSVQPDPPARVTTYQSVPSPTKKVLINSLSKLSPSKEESVKIPSKSSPSQQELVKSPSKSSPVKRTEKVSPQKRQASTPKECPASKRARGGRGGRARGGRGRMRSRPNTTPAVGRQTVDEVNLSESSSDSD